MKHHRILPNHQHLSFRIGPFPGISLNSSE